MSYYQFPKRANAVCQYLRNYDFIYEARQNKKMLECYQDVLNNEEQYREIFALFGKDLVINGTDGYIHIPSYKNKKQNINRAIKVCAIACWLTRVASENTQLVNGESVPGERFTEKELLSVSEDKDLKVWNDRDGVASLKDRISDLVSYGLLEETIQGGEKIYYTTGVLKYYQDYAMKIAALT
jgi:hypothetical protein